jgi:hypothetical protein
VPVILKLSSNQYTRWHELFLVVGKFALKDHALQDNPNQALSNWACMDRVVKSWIYDAISSSYQIWCMRPLHCALNVAGHGVSS